MKKRTSQSAKAGLMFPVSRIGRYTKKMIHKHRIAKRCPVYLAAVLEYLSAEILELAGNASRDNKKLRITPRHIFLAIANDDELKQLLKGVVISQGGVLPYLHPSLLPKGKKAPPDTHQSKASQTSPVRSPPPKTKKQLAVTLKKKSKKTSVKKKFTKIRSPKRAKSKDLDCTPSNSRPVTGVTVLLEKPLFLGQKLTVVAGDILNIAADAIINPTNKDFYMGGQVGQILEKAGGDDFKKIMDDLRTENGPLAISGAAISAACQTAAKHVIHCNGPTSRDGKAAELLAKTVKNCLSLADSKDLKSVAFPLIGTGRAGFAKPIAAEMILKTINSYFMSVMTTSLAQLYLVLYDDQSIKAVLDALSNA